MTTSKNLLVGKWEFIKAEEHNGKEWKQTTHVNAMTWEFHPEYIGDSKTIGAIIESAPLVEPLRLHYTFREQENHLRIEVYTDPETRILDETDLYIVSAQQPAADKAIIIIELINQGGCPPPYLRYTLQQV